MSNTSVICHDDAQDESVGMDTYGESSLATLEREDATSGPAESTGPRCEKCAAPIKSDVVTICRSCGWYESLGTFVEVDPAWETATEPTEESAPAQAASHLRVWLDLMPRWSWVVLASVLFVIVESVVARFATPADSWARTTWSLIQLAAGIAMVVSCHVFNFLVLAADDPDFGVLDLFLKPLKLWIRAVHNLPTRLWVTDAAASGLTAAFMSIVVIGGLPYERLWDWGFEEPVKQNLMGAVMDRAKELDSRDGSDNLEDAVGDFAGKGGVDGAELPKAEPQKPLHKADCVILGFQADRDGRLSTLFLGAVHRKQLRFAGHLTPKMTDDELDTLRHRLESIQTRQAFISIEAEDVNWVKPKYTCRVSFAEQQKNGRLREPQWEKLLGTMDAK